jgi:PPM family protein phosphatase
MSWHIVKYQHKGGREEQQDRIEIFHDTKRKTHLAILADGMGGHKGGALAAQAVIDAAHDIWQKNTSANLHPQAMLQKICDSAHEHINKFAQQHQLVPPPSSTVVVLYLINSYAYWVHIGDSRLYHFSNKKLLFRTKDHSVVQMLVDLGRIKEENMGSHPDQGRLLKGLGGGKNIEPEFGSVELSQNDVFVLCCDGFWEHITPQDMLHSINSEENLDKSIIKLVEKAVEKGGTEGDNVSAILARNFSKPNVKKTNMFLISSIFISCTIAFFLGVYLFYTPSNISSKKVEENSLQQPFSNIKINSHTLKSPDEHHVTPVIPPTIDSANNVKNTQENAIYTEQNEQLQTATETTEIFVTESTINTDIEIQYIEETSQTTINQAEQSSNITIAETTDVKIIENSETIQNYINQDAGNKSKSGVIERNLHLSSKKIQSELANCNSRANLNHKTINELIEVKSCFTKIRAEKGSPEDVIIRKKITEIQVLLDKHLKKAANPVESLPITQSQPEVQISPSKQSIPEYVIPEREELHKKTTAKQAVSGELPPHSPVTTPQAQITHQPVHEQQLPPSLPPTPAKEQKDVKNLLTLPPY